MVERFSYQSFSIYLLAWLLLAFLLPVGGELPELPPTSMPSKPLITIIPPTRLPTETPSPTLIAGQFYRDNSVRGFSSCDQEIYEGKEMYYIRVAGKLSGCTQGKQ